MFNQPTINAFDGHLRYLPMVHCIVLIIQTTYHRQNRVTEWREYRRQSIQYNAPAGIGKCINKPIASFYVIRIYYTKYICNILLSISWCYGATSTVRVRVSYR